MSTEGKPYGPFLDLKEAINVTQPGELWGMLDATALVYSPYTETQCFLSFLY